MPRPTDKAAARIFHSLGDHTRLWIVLQLGAVGAATATTLSIDSQVTRQAIVKHLQVLADAGLVTAERQGREVRYALEPTRLEDARTYLDFVSARWDRALARLRAQVEG